MPCLKSQQGFNLMEILVVLVIAGLLLGVAYPSGQFMIETNRQATEINQLLATLERARQQSLTSQRTVLVGQGEGCASLQAGSASANWSLCYRDAGQVGQQIYLRGGGQRFTVDASAERVVFRPPPLVMDEPIYLLVQTGFNRVQPRIVQVSETGRAQVLSCKESPVKLGGC